LYEDAKEAVVSTGKASSSFLQRRFSIGYARAARILDELEQNGAIGPQNGSKPRDILVPRERDSVYGSGSNLAGGLGGGSSVGGPSGTDATYGVGGGKSGVIDIDEPFEGPEVS
jgi:hypothetical protein